MAALLRLFLDLWLLRRGPQDVPYSLPLTRTLVLGMLGAHALLLMLLEPPHPLLPQLLYALLWMLGVPWLLLKLRGHESRYLQTLAAKCGVGLLYLAVFAPAILITREIDPSASAENPPTTLQMLAVWGVIGLTVWHLIVSGHIWRHALGLPGFFGTMIAVALFVSNVLLARMLFPPLSTP